MGKSPSPAPATVPEPAPEPNPVEPAPAKPAEPAVKPEPDLKIALQQERDRSKRIRGEKDRLSLELAKASGVIEQLEQSNLRENVSPEAPLDFTEDDLADPSRLNAAVNRKLVELVKAQDVKADERYQALQDTTAKQAGKEALEREFSRYELAKDPKSETGRMVRALYDRAVYDEGALGDQPTMEAARELIEQTVREVSKFVVKESEPGPAVVEPPQPAPASAGGDTAQLKPGGDNDDRSIEDRVAAGVASFDAAQQQKAGKGG